MPIDRPIQIRFPLWERTLAKMDLSKPNETPTPPPVPPTPPEVPNATDTGLAPNIAAGLAEFFSLVGGLIFYFIEKKNKFVRFHALQGIYLGAVMFLYGTVMTILVFIPFIGWLVLAIMGILTPLVGIIFTVVWLIATIQAFLGKEWEIPWLGKLARQHLAEGKIFFLKSPAP